MSADRSTPLWAWLGCGCLGLLGALIVVGVGLGIWGVRKARELGEGLRDPEARESTVLEVLGAEKLPDGYHASIAFRIPYLFDFAMLSDTPPGADGLPGDAPERGYIYLSAAGWGNRGESLRDFFEGRVPELDAFGRENVDLDLREHLARGRIPRDDDELLWSCHRGRADVERAHETPEGLVTVLLIDCDDDPRQRLGIWFAPDPAPEASGDELDLTGTVGDPEAIREFMAPMRPCPP